MISQHSESFADLKRFFEQSAQRKGGEYAFELLGRADLPEGTDIHLLGHVIGDILYKQKGKDGMRFCTQEFRNACSHTIVVGLYLDRGEAALNDIAQACKQAPGGAGAYTMCFHGLGHGILAVTGYDFEDAVAMCGRIVPGGFSSREPVECVGGALMELISGGDHDKTAWEKQSAIFLSTADPLAPCNASYVPQQAQGMCYEYITPHLFTVVGSDLTDPTPEAIRDAFALCMGLPAESSNQGACFRGFGKELVNVVIKNDIRTVDTISNEQARLMYEKCALAPTTFGRQQCMVHLVNSLYWGGENSQDSSVLFCSQVSEESDKSLCFRHFLGAVSFYTSGTSAYAAVCNQIPQEYASLCKK